MWLNAKVIAVLMCLIYWLFFLIVFSEYEKRQSMPEISLLTANIWASLLSLTIHQTF